MGIKAVRSRTRGRSGRLARWTSYLGLLAAGYSVTHYLGITNFPFVFSLLDAYDAFTYDASAPACKLLSKRARLHIQALQKRGDNAISLVYAGQIVNPGTILSAPAKVCVYASIAASPNSTLHEQAPLDEWKIEGPDELYWRLQSETALIQLDAPTISSLFPIDYADWTDSPYHSHVYSSEVTITQPGVYETTGEIGLMAWDWMKEDTEDDRQRNYHYWNISLTPASLNVQPSTRPVPYLPICDDQLGKTVSPLGTWRLNITEADGLPPPDFWGYSFQHNECRSKYYDMPARNQCLANKRIRLYGSSNLRRFSKMLHSEDRWCPGKHDLCQSEDYVDASEWGRIVGGAYKRRCNNKSIKMMDNTTSTFSFIGGLTIVAGCPLLEELESIFHRREGLQEPPIRPTDEYDIVYLSFQSWEMAFRSYIGFKNELAILKESLPKAYPHSRILIRDATNICCHGNQKGSISMKRVALFNRVLKEAFMDTPYRIIPVSVLDDRRFSQGVPAETDGMAQLWSNHLRSTEIHQEIDMVLNAVCGSA